METRIIRLDSGQPDRSTLCAVSRILQEGGVCILPTDTIYGLHCRADCPEAVETIQSLKGRERDKPLVVLTSGLSWLDDHGFTLPPAALILAQRFWPGPLTLVLPVPEDFPSAVTGGQSTVAVRHPGFPPLGKILEFTEIPLASTSVNAAGEPPLLSPSSIIQEWNGKVHAILDAGDLPVRQPSTLVAFPPEGPRILREGAIPASVILSALS